MLAQVSYLIAFSILLSVGQICFKAAANHLNDNAEIPLVMALLTNYWLWAAFVLYGFSSLLWVFILRNVPLGFAYPFVAIGFILVPLAGWFLFSERINLWYVLGVSLIISGLLIVVLMAQE